ncbi:MAG: glycosyltransferase family 2 protein [Spirochaetaceae bacterium]|nr:glycosyltransferase family 2 protein [Spirochaetaceae bacterium]
MHVSIIIVNYNTKKLLKNCLNSIYSHTKGIDFEVIVSDNGSTDGSIEMVRTEFPQVLVIENNANLGFGAANNKGLKIAKGKYIFYLNSDTVLLNNAVKVFYDYWEKSCDKENIGALGCNLLDENMNITHSYGNFAGYKIALNQLSKMFFSNIILSFLYILHIKPNKKRNNSNKQKFLGEVDYITGADLFLLNNEYAKFDEYFFLYFEEADLQKRLASMEKKRVMIDGPVIQHLCGGSVGENFSIKRKASFSRIQFELSRIKFLKKHFSKNILPIAKILVTIIWINPFLIKNTKKHIKELWEI